MSIRIYHDSPVEASWFLGLDNRLESAELKKIHSRGSNPPSIDELVVYDRPDIILEVDGQPVLVLEKSREVPTGHNVGQRFPRLVRAAEMGVPVIKFFPFDAMKHGEYAGKCHLNARLLKAFDRMTEIHDVPVLAVNWPCDDDWELIDDGSEDELLSDLVSDFIDEGFDEWCDAFDAQLVRNEKELDRRLAKRSQYDLPPGSVEITDTSSVLREISHYFDGASPNQLQSRPETVVYEIGMSPANCRREDPYTGTQFIYDYNWCRTGASPDEKERNLILHFPKIERKTWYDKNPNDSTRKSQCWYLTANAFKFKDGLDVIRE